MAVLRSRSQRGAAVREVMDKSPIQRIGERLMPREMPKARRQGRVTPEPLTEAAFISEGKKRSGSFTATETGARYLANKRNAFQEQRDILNSAQSTEKMEKKIQGKKGYK